ncbi:hypothetical protein [Brevibacillus sp. SYSU BS000544]
MWKTISGFLPSKLILFIAILSFLVPLICYKINQKLHKLIDPPWKKSKP